MDPESVFREHIKLQIVYQGYTYQHSIATGKVVS
jgi:hypothetical protein